MDKKLSFVYVCVCVYTIVLLHPAVATLPPLSQPNFIHIILWIIVGKNKKHFLVVWYY